MKAEQNGARRNSSTPKNFSSDEPQPKNLPGIWNQYYATFSVSLAAFGMGAASGWASPMILVLESDDSPVGKMTLLEISPIETLPALASLFGTVAFSGIMTRFGRKICGYTIAFVSLFGWLMLLSATYTWQLYAGRFLTGMTTFAISMIGCIYLSEIAYVEIRGTLISYVQFANHFGTLVSCCLAIVCDNYRLFTAMFMIGPVLFPIFFYWIPESPQFLVMQSQIPEARSSLAWYRGNDMKLVDDEIKSWAVEKQNLNWRIILTDRGNRKATVVFSFLFCFSILSGSSVVTGYASKIFQSFPTLRLNPNSSAAILATIKFISSLLAILVIDRFGRKVLVLFSFTSMSVCLVVLTIYSVFQENGGDVSTTGWIPLLSLSTYVATSSLGVNAVGEVIGGEMYTPEIKGVAMGFVGIIGTVLILVTLQLYPVVTLYIGSYFNYLVQAAFAISAVFIAWKIVPETKGKTVAEIREILRGDAPHINRETDVGKL